MVPCESVGINSCLIANFVYKHDVFVFFVHCCTETREEVLPNFVLPANYDLPEWKKSLILGTLFRWPKKKKNKHK